MGSSEPLKGFEEYFKLTQTGVQSTQAIKDVAEKFNKSQRTVYNWKRDYRWDQLAAERSQDLNKELAKDIKKETNQELKDHRKTLYQILYRMVMVCASNDTIEITNVRELVTVVEALTKLQDSLDIGKTQILSVNYDRSAHIKETDSLLHELRVREKNKQRKKDKDKEKAVEEVTPT